MRRRTSPRACSSSTRDGASSGPGIGADNHEIDRVLARIPLIRAAGGQTVHDATHERATVSDLAIGAHAGSHAEQAVAVPVTHLPLLLLGVHVEVQEPGLVGAWAKTDLDARLSVGIHEPVG